MNLNKITLVSGLIVSGIAVSSGFSPAKASSLTPVEIITQTMQETSATDLDILAIEAGVDPNTLLTFNSNTDPTGNTFSYSTNQGSTYNGNPVSLSTNGQFNTSLDSYNVTTTATYGLQTWTVSGLGTITTDADGVSADVTYNATITGVALNITDVHYTGGIIYPDNTTITYGYRTLFGVKIPFSDFTINDYYRNGKVYLVSTPTTPSSPYNYSITIEGNSPTQGGAGNFTGTIVPEPLNILGATTGLFLLGTVSTALKRRKLTK